MTASELSHEAQQRVDRGEAVWDTRSLQEEFTVEGFMAPFVVVIRKEDGVKGTLTFTHHPRWYFDFEPAS